MLGHDDVVSLLISCTGTVGPLFRSAANRPATPIHISIFGQAFRIYFRKLVSRGPVTTRHYSTRVRAAINPPPLLRGFGVCIMLQMTSAPCRSCRKRVEDPLAVARRTHVSKCDVISRAPRRL